MQEQQDTTLKTVDKVIKNLQKGVEIPKYKERGSIIDPYKEKVIKMLEEGLSGVRIYEELLKGGYPVLIQPFVDILLK